MFYVDAALDPSSIRMEPEMMSSMGVWKTCVLRGSGFGSRLDPDGSGNDVKHGCLENMCFTWTRLWIQVGSACVSVCVCVCVCLCMIRCGMSLTSQSKNVHKQTRLICHPLM